MTKSVGVDTDGRLWTSSDIPTVVLETSQVISTDPIKFQLTEAQSDIIGDTDIKIIQMDCTALEYPVITINRMLSDAFSGIVTTGSNPGAPDTVLVRIAYNSTNKQITVLMTTIEDEVFNPIKDFSVTFTQSGVSATLTPDEAKTAMLSGYNLYVSVTGLNGLQWYRTPMTWVEYGSNSTHYPGALIGSVDEGICTTHCILAVEESGQNKKWVCPYDPV